MIVAALITGIVVVCRKLLRRKILAMVSLLALLACAGTSSAGGVERRRINVRISSPKGGALHAFLVDEATFHRPMVGLQKRVLRVAGKGVVTISFEGVPPGTYGVRCFLDTNGNGKLDRGWFGPAEPWGMSFHGGRPRRWPRWDD
jgi:uncharacterized protein (DUF2141 family)